MEVSEEKLNANRENAKKGGVKTDDGKRKSRMNALKHGASAKLKTDYDPVDLDEVTRLFTVMFDPKDPIDDLLVEQLSIAYLQILRCRRFEAETLNETLDPPEFGMVEIKAPLQKKIDHKAAINGVYERQLINKNSMADIHIDTFQKLELVLVRYEPILFNRFFKILNQLKKD